MRKTIALRYSEIEFERLVELERQLAPVLSNLLSIAAIDSHQKTLEQMQNSLKQLIEFGTAIERAEMFLSTQEQLNLFSFRGKLLELATLHVGPNMPVIPDDNKDVPNLMISTASLIEMVRSRIKELGKL